MNTEKLYKFEEKIINANAYSGTFGMFLFLISGLVMLLNQSILDSFSQLTPPSWGSILIIMASIPLYIILSLFVAGSMIKKSNSWLFFIKKDNGIKQIFSTIIVLLGWVLLLDFVVCISVFMFILLELINIKVANIFSLPLFVIPNAILILIVYFVPYLIADHRKHCNKNAILLLNIFLGFTVIGWIVALVWSALALRAAQQRGSSRHRPSKPLAFPSSRLIRRPVRI